MFLNRGGNKVSCVYRLKAREAGNITLYIGFRKQRGISCTAERPLTSQEGCYSMELDPLRTEFLHSFI
jgi:hypothetical protein